MIYFVLVIVVHSCTHGLPDNIHKISVSKDDDAPVVLFNSATRRLRGLASLCLHTFVNQLIRGVLGHDGPHAHQVHSCLRAGMTLCFLLYAMVSFFGYMDFGRKVDGSILLMYDPLQEPEVMVAYVGVLSKLCASYSLLFMACRNAIYHIIGWDADELPYWKHCIAVTILSTIVLFCGLFIPKIQTVLGFAGSITGGSLGFLLPALFAMYSGIGRGGRWDASTTCARTYCCCRCRWRRVRYWCDDLGHRLRLEGNGSLYMNDFSFFLFI
ncbi:putative amino acid transporter [Trypanosoma cruzi]|uniref:Putative amino acid transporter n=1 Tax=Trypanosoma cruzi TaxID=5693 RepID=A0A2V2VQ99_TRYCR|nr:putative amino acid transporter [Trypanosoma cruzi]